MTQRLQRTDSTSVRNDSHSRWVVEFTWGVLTAGLALAVAVLSMRLWEWTPGTPFDLGRDRTFVSMQLKDIYDHGWYWYNPDIGFPFGQNGSWFPELHIIHVAAIRAIGWFCADPFTPGVLYFVAGFPLAGLTGYLLARSQGLAAPSGVLVGVLLANAPGHVEQFGHLYIAAYWVVPVSMWLILEVAAGRPLLSRRQSGAVRWTGSRTVVTLGAVVVVGLSGVYYVGFTLVLLAVVTLVRRALSDTPRSLLPGLGVMTGLAATIAVPLLVAKLATRQDLVTGRVPARRSFVESELFAGKLTDLVLPWIGHRIDALAAVTWGYRATTSATMEESAIGLVALVGTGALFAIALVSLFGARAPQPDAGRWSGLLAVAFLMYTVGGLGMLIALFSTGQVRTWSRMSLYIMLLGLLSVAYWLTRLQRRRGLVVAMLASGLLVAVGALDQTNPERAPVHSAVTAEMRELGQYASSLEAATVPGCGVFQIPVVPFPETLGPFSMESYDQLKPYLAGSDLKWSVGAMRGTAKADWQLAVESDDLTTLATGLVAAGFCALEVDTLGFDHPDGVISRLSAVFGDPVAQTADREFVAFDVRGVGAGGRGESGPRARLLEPVVVSLQAYPVEEVDGVVGQYVGPAVGVDIANLAAAPRPVSVSMDITPLGGKSRTIVASLHGRELARVTVPAGSTGRLAFDVRAREGVTSVALHTDGLPDKEPGGDRTVSAWVTDMAASSVPSARVATVQEQVATGWVVQ